MGDAYTPGLTVTRDTVVRKTRRLPLAGEVLVAVGARVSATDIVARTELPGKVSLVNIATALGLQPDEVAPKLTVQIGGAVTRGAPIAQTSSLFGLFTQRIPSPVDGVLEAVSAVTGMALLREAPSPVEVAAYVDGTVVEVLAGEGVVIETRGALVQGIFGLAGERQASIVVVARDREQVLDAVDLKPEHRGKIVIGGARTTLAALRRAIELEVAAIVCGGFAYQDVRELLGYDVGVAITGNEALATTLVVTEGFGDIAMADATYELLASLEGKLASVDGATQIRAGVIRPEVLVPSTQAEVPTEPGREPRTACPGPSTQAEVPTEPAGDVTSSAAVPRARGFELGAAVRCIRAPYFGRIGTVTRLPIELAEMPTETRARVVEVDLAGERVIVPRANVEVIE